MPEVNDYQLHLQGADGLILQRTNNQGCFSRCFSCNSGVKSEFFNACLECRDLLQDGKPGDGKAAPQPPLVVDPCTFWVSDAPLVHNPPAPVGVTVPENHVPVPFATRVTKRPRSPTSPRDQHARSPTSPYRTLYSQRGRPPNGSRKGPKGFTGVRQRKGVRGFLVEIRPPKWRRTIWLGTYNTDREAAGAYDAGIYYTGKKTKYNFPALQGTFPPLPAQLRLDNLSDSDQMDQIKLFVQKEARIASQKVKSLPAESCATSTVTEQSGPPAGGATPVSSEDCEAGATTSTSEIGLPLDEEFLQSLSFPSSYPSFFLDELACCNVGFQPYGGLSQPTLTAWQMSPFELKQEDDGLL